MYAALSDQLVGTAVQRLHFISCADSWTEKNHGEWITNQDLMAREGKKNKQKKTAACETLDDSHAAALKVQQDNSALQCFPTL